MMCQAEKRVKFTWHVTSYLKRQFRPADDARARNDGQCAGATPENRPKKCPDRGSWVRVNNEEPKPFVWTRGADEIIEKVSRCQAIMETPH